MDKVSVNPQFQVVIPKVVREKVHIKAGKKFCIYEGQGIII